MAWDIFLAPTGHACIKKFEETGEKSFFYGGISAGCGVVGAVGGRGG
jgi:hypothetical protein